MGHRRDWSGRKPHDRDHFEDAVDSDASGLSVVEEAEDLDNKKAYPSDSSELHEASTSQETAQNEPSRGAQPRFLWRINIILSSQETHEHLPVSGSPIVSSVNYRIRASATVGVFVCHELRATRAVEKLTLDMTQCFLGDVKSDSERSLCLVQALALAVSPLTAYVHVGGRRKAPQAVQGFAWNLASELKTWFSGVRRVPWRGILPLPHLQSLALPPALYRPMEGGVDADALVYLNTFPFLFKEFFDLILSPDEDASTPGGEDYAKGYLQRLCSEVYNHAELQARCLVFKTECPELYRQELSTSKNQVDLHGRFAILLICPNARVASLARQTLKAYGRNVLAASTVTTLESKLEFLALTRQALMDLSLAVKIPPGFVPPANMKMLRQWITHQTEVLYSFLLSVKCFAMSL